VLPGMNAQVSGGTEREARDQIMALKEEENRLPDAIEPQASALRGAVRTRSQRVPGTGRCGPDLQ